MKILDFCMNLHLICSLVVEFIGKQQFEEAVLAFFTLKDILQLLLAFK